MRYGPETRTVGEAEPKPPVLRPSDKKPCPWCGAATAVTILPEPVYAGPQRVYSDPIEGRHQEGPHWFVCDPCSLVFTGTWEEWDSPITTRYREAHTTGWRPNTGPPRKIEPRHEG